MSRQRAFGAVVVLACLASLAAFFRPFVFSGFDLLPGSLGDGRLLITILEHWTNAFRGRAHALSPPFFAPARGVLGYSESMFLVSLPYAALRLSASIATSPTASR